MIVQFPYRETPVSKAGNYSVLVGKLEFLRLECTVLDLVDNFAFYT